MEWNEEYPLLCKLYITKGRFGDKSISAVDDERIGKLFIALTEKVMLTTTSSEKSMIDLALDPNFNAMVTAKVKHLRESLFEVLGIDGYPQKKSESPSKTPAGSR